jgi:hypothetical protein
MVAGALLVGGCADPNRGVREGEPIGLQVLRGDAGLKGMRFNTLLDFESDSDGVFVSAEPGGGKVERERAHTGKGSLRLPPGCERAVVKLASLLTGRPFPGEWTLAGAYLWTKSGGRVTVSYEVDGTAVAVRQVALEEGKWTVVMLDVSELAGPALASGSGAGAGNLVFTFPAGGAGESVWMDDVLLVDNSQVIVAGGGRAGARAWSLRRRGFKIIGNAPGRFAFKLPSAEAGADGWELVEANALRARFRSGGKAKALTVYSDGRAMWDGVYRPFAADEMIGAGVREAHEAPGEVSVPEDMGKVDRTSEGDANHDGYNEARGAYQVVARGARVDVTLMPKGWALVKPVVEVAGLPAGKALVTIEGQMVEKVVRTGEGHLLVELPVRIERGATVNVRVE